MSKEKRKRARRRAAEHAPPGLRAADGAPRGAPPKGDSSSKSCERAWRRLRRGMAPPAEAGQASSSAAAHSAAAARMAPRGSTPAGARRRVGLRC